VSEEVATFIYQSGGRQGTHLLEEFTVAATGRRKDKRLLLLAADSDVLDCEAKTGVENATQW
jgi:hypothetical protein